eukprot:419748-Pelagomonas_calceolata.AAC.5
MACKSHQHSLTLGSGNHDGATEGGKGQLRLLKILQPRRISNMRRFIDNSHGTKGPQLAALTKNSGKGNKFYLLLAIMPAWQVCGSGWYQQLGYFFGP